jgi:catalase
MTVQRTFATARWIEFDAILLGAAPEPAPDAVPARDDRAGSAAEVGIDPRVRLLVDECWQHAKAIGGWGPGVSVIEESGVAGKPGVVTADSGMEAYAALHQLLATHRVWERFPASVS